MAGITVDINEIDDRGYSTGKTFTKTLSLEGVAEIVDLAHRVSAIDDLGMDSARARRDLVKAMAALGVLRSFPKPSALRVDEVRTTRLPEISETSVKVPFLFASRGFTATGRSVKWLDEGVLTIRRVAFAQDYTVKLDRSGSSWPAADKVEVQRIGEHCYAPFLDHPDSPYMRARINPTGQISHFINALAWRTAYADPRDRSSLHPLEQLRRTMHMPRDPIPERSSYGETRAVLSDVSFSGACFEGYHDDDPIYESYEKAILAVGPVKARFDRLAIMAEMAKLQDCFVWSDDQILMIINEPKIVVGQDSEVKNADVVSKVSVADHPMENVRFPMDMEESAHAFAERLAAVRGRKHRARITPFIIHRNQGEGDFEWSNVLRLVQSIAGSKHPSVREVLVAMKEDNEKSILPYVEALRTIVDEIPVEEVRKDARTVGEGRAISIAKDALDVFLETYAPKLSQKREPCFR